MLTVNARQWQRLEDWAEQVFLSSARAHVAEHFADRCARLGPAATESLLRQALDDAKALGLDLQPQVLRYLSLVFEFGPGFPRRQEDAWARSILGDGLPDRLERLFHEGLARSQAAGAPPAAARGPE